MLNKCTSFNVIPDLLKILDLMIEADIGLGLQGRLLGCLGMEELPLLRMLCLSKLSKFL